MGMLLRLSAIRYDRIARSVTQPIKVYIVDDSAQLAEMLCELLADPGRVEISGTADSVAQATADIGRLRPDVVVVDLQLKDGNGFQIVQAVRAMPDAAGIEIVLFTNHISTEFRKRAEDLGANHFLDKSKDHPRLVELVRQKADHNVS